MAGTRQHYCISGNALAWAHFNFVADREFAHRHGDQDAVAIQVCGCRTQRIEGIDGLHGLVLGTDLQPLAQAHQRDDDGSRFEVQRRHRGRHVACSMLGRSLPAQQFKNTQAKSGAGAQGDQNIHVSGAGPQRTESTAIKARSQYELHWRGQGQLKPAGEG